MELKNRLNSRKIFITLYLVSFLIYIVYGLQPVDASEAYVVNGVLNIPSIGLSVDVTNIQIEDGKLNTPSSIVGSYSNNSQLTLLIGHSTGVFKDLANVTIGDSVIYNNTVYKVSKSVLIEKDNINMDQLLSSVNKKTLVIMTCAGDLLDNGDATHRFIVFAST